MNCVPTSLAEARWQWSQQHLPAARVLWPLQRVFEPVLVASCAGGEFAGRWSAVAVRFNAFSESPEIAWHRTVDSLAAEPWRGVLAELQLRLMDGQLVTRGGEYVVLFCREPIAGELADLAAALPDAGELARLFRRRGEPLIMIAGVADESLAPGDAAPEHVLLHAARVLDTSNDA